MKPITLEQKKWAMTACLLTALTFTLSMNTHSDGLSSADFASESGDLVEGKLTTVDGVVPVKYIRNGDKEVLAVVPKMTEGRACDACGRSYNLDIAFDKNKDNIDALNVALLKEIADSGANLTKASTLEKPERKEGAEVDDKLAEKIKRDHRALVSSIKYCAEEELAAQSECAVSAFLSRLRSGKIAPEAALSVFKSEIEPKLSKVLLNFPDPFSTDQDKYKYKTDLQDIVLTMDQLKSNLPSEYNNVRERAVAFEKQIIEANTQKFKHTLNGMLTNPNDNRSNVRARYELDNINYLSTVFDHLNNPNYTVVDSSGQYVSSLRKAVEFGHLTTAEALEIYTNQYQSAVTSILNGANRAYRVEFANGRLQTYIDISQIGGTYSPDLPNTNPRLGPGRGVGPSDLAPNASQRQTTPQREFSPRGSMNQQQPMQGQQLMPQRQQLPQGQAQGRPGRPVNGGRGF